MAGSGGTNRRYPVVQKYNNVNLTPATMFRAKNKMVLLSASLTTVGHHNVTLQAER